MSLAEGQQVELAIEKPAAGGRMIARHLGQVVLVRGAIPGERVTAWIERAEKRMAYAVTREVVEASPDRRDGADDPLCGGALYSHIRYERQLAIKSDVVRDAFARLGRYPINHEIPVAASPEEAYRMRARFHVHEARAGFYREGTHQLCDAAPTKQLRAGTMDVVRHLTESLHRERPDAVTSIAITENIAADERAAHLEIAPGAMVDAAVLERTGVETGLRGISAHEHSTGRLVTAGSPDVSDPVRAVTDGRVADGTVRRHAESFFQGNRFLLPALVTAVADAVPETGEVLDLYAGVGLFCVPLAAMGHLEVTAVEGDRASGADLRENARALQPRLKTHVFGVEDYLAARKKTPATVIVDPPRTGLSKEACERLARLAAPRIVYVSCDPPTLARDARRLLDAGYRLRSLRAFDLFPNTPHVESLAVFTYEPAL
jgi:23S rRNA (uracil1939-C5)-methyltransferase